MVPTSCPLKGQAQGFGLVDGIVVKVGEVLDVGDTSIFEFWVDVTIPTQPGVQELRLVFQDGLQGGGIPIKNRVTFAENGALPSTLDVLRTSCTLLVSSGGNVNFRRGDDDGNGKLEVTDPIVSLTFQFVGGVHPLCLDALDFDDSGVIDISDAIASLTRQFLGGPPPKKPGIESCGPDPATPPDNLDCIAYDSCDV